MATFAVATNEFRGNGKERAEYHNVVVWDRLAKVCGQYLGKVQQVASATTPEERKALDNAENMKTRPKPEHRAMHSECCVTYHECPQNRTSRADSREVVRRTDARLA